MLSIRVNQMWSLDVVRLFTKFPTDKTLSVVQDKLELNPFLVGLIKVPIDDGDVAILHANNILPIGFQHIPTKRRLSY